MQPIMITLNKIMDKHPCKDGLNRLLKMQGKQKDCEGDDVEFPMSDILKSNILDDAIWAMRCLPDHALIWRKFALWCGNKDLQVKFEQKNADYVAFWCAKYACGKSVSSAQMLSEKERQAEKLRKVLDAGFWID